MGKPIFFSIVVVLLFLSFSQTPNAVPFTVKEYGNLANYFDTQKDMLAFFDFHKGDVVADVGAGDAKHEGAFSLLTDGITFYAEDIDAKKLDQNAIDKVIKHYSKLKGSPLTNTIKFVIGTEKMTNLPKKTFDKVIICSAFHEFTEPNDMIDDIDKKIKPTGRIYILETACYENGHTNVEADEVISKMKIQGFELVKKYVPKSPLTYCLIFKNAD